MTLALTLIVLPLCSIAESVTRSDPQTAGEKRLLEWDLNKTYDLSRKRTDSGTKAPSKSAETRSFRSGIFNTKAFSAGPFASSEFLTPSASTLPKPFSARPHPSANTSSLPLPSPGAGFGAPPKAVPAFSTKGSTDLKNFREASRTYAGIEAQRKDEKYLPENAPKGGVIEGRRLTVEEVREILNKSK